MATIAATRARAASTARSKLAKGKPHVESTQRSATTFVVRESCGCHAETQLEGLRGGLPPGRAELKATAKVTNVKLELREGRSADQPFDIAAHGQSLGAIRHEDGHASRHLETVERFS